MLEHEVLDELLENAISNLHNEGCNDFKITVSDNNRDQIIEMLQGDDSGYGETMIERVRDAKIGEKIYFLDYMLLGYIKDKLAKRMNEL